MVCNERVNWFSLSRRTGEGRGEGFREWVGAEKGRRTLASLQDAANFQNDYRRSATSGYYLSTLRVDRSAVLPSHLALLPSPFPYPTAMPSRNSMLLFVFFSLFNINSIASTGGTPVRARRRITTLLYSSG